MLSFPNQSHSHHSTSPRPIPSEVSRTFSSFLIMYSFVHASLFLGSPINRGTNSAECDAVPHHRSPSCITMSDTPLSRRAVILSALAIATSQLLPSSTIAEGLPIRPPTAEQRAKELRELIAKAVVRDPTIAGTLLRLAFHDSFTMDPATRRGGANGSIRLETARGENFGLARAVDVLRPLQELTALSWGDVVAIGGAQAVESTGGPRINVRLGRENATVEDPGNILPKPDLVVSELRDLFGPRGFDDRDIVALSGAHTLGRAGGGGPFVAEPNKFKNEYVFLSCHNRAIE